MSQLRPWWSVPAPVIKNAQVTLNNPRPAKLTAVACGGSPCVLGSSIVQVGWCYLETPGFATIQHYDGELIIQSQCRSGPFELSFAGPPQTLVYGRLFAINAAGVVGYSDVLTFEAPGCLVEGTAIAVRLPDGTIGTKPVQDVTYLDDLLVWDFDTGVLATSRPLWIKRAEAIGTSDELTLSNGQQLHTVGHRVLCVDTGAFETAGKQLVGTHTAVLTPDGSGVDTSVTVTGYRQIPNRTVRFYNVITHTHMNLFANNVLTSCRFSNLAPIRDMRYDAAGKAGIDDVVASRGSWVSRHGPEYALGMQLSRQQHMEPHAIDAYVAHLHRLALPWPVLFLDFQGVMRTRAWPQHVGCLADVLADTSKEGPCFDPDAVCALNTLLRAVPTLQVVVSSDWAAWCTLEQLVELARSEGFVRPPVACLLAVAAHKPGHHKATTVITTSTVAKKAAPVPEVQARAARIQAWVRAHPTTAWLAVDDLALDEHLPRGRALRINPALGLTQDSARMALQLLCDQAKV